MSRASTNSVLQAAAKSLAWDLYATAGYGRMRAFIKVMCPSTQSGYFLRVGPDAENAKQGLESTLIGYTRDWERDLVAET